jgi:hypothetical protein
MHLLLHGSGSEAAPSRRRSGGFKKNKISPTANPYSALDKQTASIGRRSKGTTCEDAVVVVEARPGGGGDRLARLWPRESQVERPHCAARLFVHHFWCLPSTHQGAPAVYAIYLSSPPPPSWRPLRFTYCLLIPSHGTTRLHGMSSLFLRPISSAPLILLPISPYPAS